MILVFLCLTYFTQYDNLQVHPCCYKWHYFIFLWLNCIVYMYHIFFIHSSVDEHFGSTFIIHSFYESGIWTWLSCTHCCKVSHKATVLARVGASSEGLTDEGSISNLICLLAVFSLLWAMGLRASVPCWQNSRGHSHSAPCPMDLFEKAIGRV